VHGAIPVFARYTTGKAIDVNAAEFDERMQHLCTQWPGGPLRRVVVVGHSMGGLVATRAMHLAGTDSRWSPLVTDLVTLGSPLTGAPLERVSNRALNAVIRCSPTAAPIAQLGHHRSAGIKDLGYGVYDPVPADVKHTAVVAGVGSETTNVVSRIFGDGMVPTSSAKGPHHTAANVEVVSVPRSHHWSLTGHPDITELIVEVIAGRSSAVRAV
jgi:pimeloyl-ACP methyl ester carboxylesterase